MSRKIILAIALLLLATSMVALYVKPGKCSNVFSQAFDDKPTGSAPQGWVVDNPNACSLTVNDTVYYGSGGKSARYADLASYPGGYSYVGRAFDDQHGSLMLSFAMMAEDPDCLMLYIDDGTVHGANIYFMPYGKLAYYDDALWHDICPFSIGTWYRIKMVIDIPKNTYDIYVDDSLKVQGAHFRGFGLATNLNRIEFGCNSYETPVGYIDEISLESYEKITPVITLAGGLDYLAGEDVNIRLDALVKDANTLAIVSNANVTMEIYYPNGSLWVSDTMIEKMAGTGIYEWESAGTIHQMNLEKGVYLVRAEASAGDSAVSSNIVLFHIDPPAGPKATPTMPEAYYTALVITLIAGMIISAVLLRRGGKQLLKTSNSQIDVKQAR